MRRHLRPLWRHWRHAHRRLAHWRHTALRRHGRRRRCLRHEHTHCCVYVTLGFFSVTIKSQIKHLRPLSAANSKRPVHHLTALHRLLHLLLILTLVAHHLTRPLRLRRHSRLHRLRLRRLRILRHRRLRHPSHLPCGLVDGVRRSAAHAIRPRAVCLHLRH